MVWDALGEALIPNHPRNFAGFCLCSFAKLNYLAECLYPDIFNIHLLQFGHVFYTESIEDISQSWTIHINVQLHYFDSIVDISEHHLVFVTLRLFFPPRDICIRHHRVGMYGIHKYS